MMEHRATRGSTRPAESHAAASSARPSAARILEVFVAVPDLEDFLVSLSTERCRHERERRVTLRRRQVTESQTLTLEHWRRKIGPAGALRAVEGECGRRTLRIVERRQEGIRCRHHARRRAHWWRRRGRALHRPGRDGNDQGQHTIRRVFMDLQ